MKQLLTAAILTFSVSLFAAPPSGPPGKNHRTGVVEVFSFEHDARVSAGRGASAGEWKEAARLFARSHARALGGALEDFEALTVNHDELGQVHVRLRQEVRGLPVVGGDLVIHAKGESGELLGVNGVIAPSSRLPRHPELDASVAIAKAAEVSEFAGWASMTTPELTYVVGENLLVSLAWTTVLSYEDDEGEHLDRIFVDAIDGELVAVHPLIHTAKYRKTYTCSNGTSLPGTLLFNEGGSSSDTVAMAAYNNGGITYDYYYKRHGRDSYNGSGATISQSVHYSSNYNNAFWNGSQMVYGDGDGTTFAPLAKALDVVAHELTHAVTQYEANLTYKNESGALNEAMSDVFAAATEAYKDGTVNTDTWKIGEDVYTPGTSGDALRYMNNPTKDGSSKDYYQERYVGTSDNGGVHWNSGIANLSFYLLSQGGTHPRSKTSVSVTGIGITKADRIFYRALTVYLTSSSNYRNARALTIRAANDLYGSTSAEAAAVGKAWNAVGNEWTTYSGSISTSGGSQVQPSGSYYQTSTTGYHTGHLFGPSGTDFDLYLQKWNGSSWANVAKAETSSSAEQIQYNGSSGYYRWVIKSYSGTGSYTLYQNRPK